jgi:hypothetical protein
MPAPKVCYHCKEPLTEGAPHDCWSTTEDALTRDLDDDLRDAWRRLRAFAVTLGEQRIYASHSSIMFSRRACHFFVRPKAKRLELCVFLRRTVKSPLVKRAQATSAVKVAHMIHVTHPDDIDAPITDWLAEAYGGSAELTKPAPKPAAKPRGR